MSEFSYRTIAKPVESKLTEKNSRFFAFATAIDDEQDVQQFLEKLHTDYPKASHYCYAYRLGKKGDLYRANDDGEPSGSAGRPILGQIDSFELTNLLIVVVRYYGGVNLGVSGLIKAYKGAARLALQKAKMVRINLKSKLKISLQYAQVNDFQSWVNQHKVEIISEQYGNHTAEYLLEFNLEDEESIKNWVKEFTS